MAAEHVDIIIVGAGLSGIGAAWHLQKHCPDKKVVILEGRQAIGGTWDLFRYPGIRSDSDMYTLGYNFKPWTDDKSIADGPTIRDYIRETARENGIERKIRFGHKVLKSSWSTAAARWTLTVQKSDSPETVELSCNFVMMCTGYYRYEAGFTPEFPGREQFMGTLIHPQHWPENLDYSGKRVVVIGSGATAVTLVPAMADKAAHVTMLQRSPTYVISLPGKDPIALRLRKFLPEKLVYRMTRARNVAMSLMLYNLSREKPALIRRFLLSQVRRQVGNSVDMKHFTPRYNPWEERLCAVPDGDLFKSIRNGKVSVVTDHIDTFTAKGIQLKSGQHLDADIVVTATGLVLQLMGGASIEIDGKPFDMSTTMGYKGLMFNDVPNLAMVFGYTNASWTLKADLSCEYVCRLLKHMDEHGYRQCMPHNRDVSVQPVPFLDLASGYVQRAAAAFPKQGSKAPWRLYQNYAKDLAMLRYGKLLDGVLQFSNPAPGASTRKRA